MDKITVNFGRILDEMTQKNFSLCLLPGIPTWFVVVDRQYYKMDSVYAGRMLDTLIRENAVVDFTPTPVDVDEILIKDFWTVEDVRNYIKNQNLANHLA